MFNDLSLAQQANLKIKFSEGMRDLDDTDTLYEDLLEDMLSEDEE